MKDFIIIPREFLTETALAKLYTNTTSGFDTPRQQTSGRVRIVSKKFIAAPRAGAVGVWATTSSSAKTYDTKMFFYDVIYKGNEEEEDEENNMGGNYFTFQTEDGQDYSIEPLSYTMADVEVSCTCLDFYYRFAVWNDSDGSLFGNAPPTYIKKTDRKPLNPQRLPGLCKHLMSLTTEIRQERFLQ